MAETYTVTVEPLGQEVTCRDDQTILDACLRAGVWLPHACTHGTCGTCKVQVDDGEVDHGAASEFALMDFERSEGKTLPCTAKPLSDVVIEADIEVEDGVVFHPVQDFTATVAVVEDIARDIRRVVLDLDGDIVFNPGQYVKIDVPGAGVDRTYSMANPQSEPRRVELNIRRVPGGVATDGWVFAESPAGLAAGDTVTLSGPYGRFFLRDRRTEPVILIGGGTGLAPLKSIVQAVLERGLPQPLFLYHGARTRADLYDVDWFEALEREHPDQFSYRPVLSEESWDGRTGMVTDAVEADFETCRGHVAYVCGPPPMVDAALKTLMKRRLFPKDIYREDFFNESDKAGGGVRSPLMKR
jgi:phenol hydroxylase P5 protein